MFRFVLSTFVTYMFLNTANAQPPQISARTQEAIFVMQSLCLATSDISIEAKGQGGVLILKKGLKVEGEYKETEVTSLLKKLQSEVSLLAEADKIRDCTKPHIEKILNSILGQGTPEKSSQVDGNVSFWNNGRPLWKDLERNAGTGSNSRVISWEDGCYLCEAENNASMTKCYATVAEAKASEWSNGFSGFHPQVKAWCSPSQQPIEGVRMDLNTRNNAIMLR